VWHRLLSFHSKLLPRAVRSAVLPMSLIPIRFCSNYHTSKYFVDRIFELDDAFKVAWRMDGPIRKIAMKYRFGRKRWSLSLSPERKEQLKDIPSMSTIGEMECLDRFGLLPSRLRTVWDSIFKSFTSSLDPSMVCQMNPEHVFLLLLQFLRKKEPIRTLGPIFGISSSSAAKIIAYAMPLLRTCITSTHIWPPPCLRFKYNSILGFNIFGAIDCRFQERTRVHPGQAWFYRSDKAKHGVSVQLICDYEGT
jgi:hypothetical protein